MVRGKFILQQGVIINTSAMVVATKSTLVVYEVLRVMQGIPLFLEEHVERLLHSFSLIGKTVNVDSKTLNDQIQTLTSKNGFSEGNVMFRFLFDHEHWLDQIYFIPHKYPEKQDYRNGVELGVLHAERLNPGAKIVQQSIREKANQLIAQNNWYEVLLVNNHGSITEGSRSNVFFVKGETLYTSPLSEVLTGITFKRVLSICKRHGIKVDFNPILLVELNNYEAAFLTGTSSKVLSVLKIEGHHFNPEYPLVQKLIQLYNAEIEAYVSKFIIDN